MTTYSAHADRRCRQRGITHEMRENFLRIADREAPAGSGCTMLGLSSSAAALLPGGERLARLLAVQGPDGSIRTIMKLGRGRAGKAYRRRLKGSHL